MSEKVRGDVTSLLSQLLASQEDVVRTPAAAALGCLVTSMNETELREVMSTHLLDADDKCDWCLRHGRCLALSVAILEAGDKIIESQFAEKVEQVSLVHSQTDRVRTAQYTNSSARLVLFTVTLVLQVPVACAGLRCVAYLLCCLLRNEKPLSKKLVTPLVQVPTSCFSCHRSRVIASRLVCRR